jgi:hypothetical protein
MVFSHFISPQSLHPPILGYKKKPLITNFNHLLEDWLLTEHSLTFNSAHSLEHVTEKAPSGGWRAGGGKWGGGLQYKTDEVFH